MTIKIGLKVAGFFEMAVIKPDGTRKVVAERQPNVILDNWLNKWPGNYWGGQPSITAQPFSTVSVGTSNAAVLPTQSGLVARVATSSAASGNPAGSSISGVEPYWAENWKRYTFPVGALNGEPLAEVGLGNATNMYTRALIKDSEGLPTTITILSDEQLELTYYFRVYPPVGDVVTVHNGITCTTRAYNANTSAWTYGNYLGTGRSCYNMNLGFRSFYATMVLTDYAGNHGGSGATGGFASVSYSRAGDNRSLTISTSPGTTQSNGTWQGMTWGSDGSVTGEASNTLYGAVGSHFQTHFSPAIVKTSLDVMSLSVTIHWDRY
jgi:hypothetical protein